MKDDAHQHFIFGLHAVYALLQHQPHRVLSLFIQKDKSDQKINSLIDSAKQKNIAIDKVARPVLDRMTNDANHQGVVAACKKLEIYSEEDLLQLIKKLTVPPLLLVLDGVQDPHNLGACFRSADASGVHAVIAPKDRAVGITPIVSKVASGATETVPFVQVTNLVRALQHLKDCGIWIYGASGDADVSLFQTDLKGPAAIVLGAEGVGLRRLTRENCDVLMHIPMQGSVSSLNVSVAAGVCLFEVVRQRSVVLTQI